MDRMPDVNVALRIGSDGYVSSSNPGLSRPGGLAVDSGNNLYISDYSALKIYRYRTNGTLEVFAGSGNSGFVDGNGIFTSFEYPTAHKLTGVYFQEGVLTFAWHKGSEFVIRKKDKDYRRLERLQKKLKD